MRLYILGAGASKPDGVPLTKELFEEAFWNFGGEIDGRPNHYVLGTWEKPDVLQLRPVFALYDRFYGTQFEMAMDKVYKDAIHPHNLEVNTSQIGDFFTRLYRMLHGSESYGVKLEEREILEISRLSAYLFFHTLCYAGIGSEHLHYWAFVDKALRRAGEQCIISFNYDLLLDDWLTRLCQRFDSKRGIFVPLEELRWTYGIDFAGIYHQQYYEFPWEAKISYYKLHGSLNMSINPTSKEVSVHTLVADHHSYWRFHRGEWPAQPLLIPPLLQKEIDIPSMAKLWDMAREKLSEAQEVHIIGYSAPDADRLAIELLKHVNHGRLARVVIANPSNSHRRRLQALVGISSSQTTVYDSFEQYLQSEYGADLTPGKARQAAEAI